MPDEALTPLEWSRYSRHLALPEVGREGQKRLRAGSVLVVGAGGLGSPAALYLAAAGVGRIGLADFDRVEESNLQRQIIHSTRNVGRPKLDSAAERIQELNPFTQVTKHDARLDSSNALAILEPYDVVVDGTDNFPTRYLLNDACVLLRKPYAYGSVFRFEGQASLFAADGGPCYRCLYPEPPPPAMVPSCEEGGVLGVIPGIIGSIQTAEALKVLLGRGRTLAGRLLLFDAMTMEFRELRVRRNPECPVCGDDPAVRALIDYEEFCGMRRSAGGEITPQELADALSSPSPPLLVDVREDYEWDVSRIEGAAHVPLARLRAEIARLPRDREIILYCRSGARSARGVAMLRTEGFAARNLAGGLVRWVSERNPSMPVV